MLDISMDFSHITKTLKALPQQMQKDMLDKATRAGSKIVRKATVSRLPKDKSGNLMKSLIISKVKTHSPFLSVMQVKFAQGGKYKGYHANLIEKGHVIWKRKKRGRGSVESSGKKYEMESTGKRTRPRPMLRPAFLTNKTNILREVQKSLGVENIERLVLKKIRTRARLPRRR